MDLHYQVADLFPGPKRMIIRALVHALIDLGQITEVKCTWTDCVLPDVPLEPSGIRRACVTLDHIKARINGGTDHWSNLQLLHHTCNMRKSHDFTDDHRKKISDAVRQRWQNEEYRQAVVPKIADKLREPEVRKKKSEAMKKHWSDPERKAAHSAKLPRGDAWRKARN